MYLRHKYLFGEGGVVRATHLVVASAALMLLAGMAQSSLAQSSCEAGQILHEGRCVADERTKPNTMNLSIEKKNKDIDLCQSDSEGYERCRQSAIETDKIFDDGDVIVLKGTVSSFTEKSAVAIVVRDSAGNIAGFAQVTPTKSSTAGSGSETNPRAIPGSFEVEIRAAGSTWKASGDYTIITTYGTDKSEINFPFTGSTAGGGSTLTGEAVPPTDEERPPTDDEDAGGGDVVVTQEKLKVLEVLENGNYVIAEDQVGLVPPTSLRGPAADGTGFIVDPAALDLAPADIELPPPKPVVEKLNVLEVLENGNYVIAEDQLGLVPAASLRGPTDDGSGFIVDPAGIGLAADMITLPPPKPTPPPTEKPKPQCGAGTEPDENGICQLVEPADNRNGCLIATAAYGSELAPQVQALREMRDGTLYSTGAGSSFISGFNQVYYAFSPAVADLEREHPAFKEAVRAAIAPMLASLSIMSLAEPGSESDVLGYGIAVIALNLAMYAGVPAGAVIAARRAIAGRRF